MHAFLPGVLVYCNVKHLIFHHRNLYIQNSGNEVIIADYQLYAGKVMKIRGNTEEIPCAESITETIVHPGTPIF